jgi:hypothetical protein
MNTILASISAAATHLNPAVIPLKICPKAPPGAQQYADQITGYVMWGVGILFTVGVIVAIGSIVAGRIFNMPHASKAGIVGIFVVLLAAITYVVAPGIVDSILGNGCI